MIQIMKLGKAQSNAADSTSETPKGDPGTPEIVEQLRHRLLNSPSDSIETKVAIVGEMAYWCYRQLAKRKYL